MNADPFRVYLDPSELADDGYPWSWHGVRRVYEVNGLPPRYEYVAAIKDIVREQAGHRCVRCGHPYRKGEHGNGEWSPCDEHCTHGHPLRFDGHKLAAPGPEEARSYIRAYSMVEAQWRILTVHHLNGIKHDCRWWNLVALCQVCHLRIQGRVRMEQVYPHPHTEWFKLFAAGYYAWAYLGLDLSREETMARIDELLALELDPAYD